MPIRHSAEYQIGLFSIRALARGNVEGQFTERHEVRSLQTFSQDASMWHCRPRLRSADEIGVAKPAGRLAHMLRLLHVGRFVLRLPD